MGRAAVVMSLQKRLVATLTLGLIAATPAARGQDPERRPEIPRQRPRPEGAPQSQVARTSPATSDADLDQLASRIASGVSALYEDVVRTSAAPPADCHDPVGVAAYEAALRNLGRATDCLAWVDRCEAQLPAGSHGLERVLSEGARCASWLGQNSRAHGWHDRATQPIYLSSEVYPGIVYRFARFAYFSRDYGGEVDAILVRNPAWAGSKLPVVHGAIEYLDDGATTRAPEVAIRAELTDWIAHGDPYLRHLALIDWGWDLLWNRDRARDAVRFYADNLAGLADPQDWWPTSYDAVHSAVVDRDFTPARRVYDAVLPYVHPRSFLPVESSLFTYSTLYGDICASQLTTGPAQSVYDSIRRDWLMGALPTAQARERALRLLSTEGDRADVLTLLGGLAEDLGNDDEARDRYWRAHQLCPYYGRAHAGLRNIVWRSNEALVSGHDAIAARVDGEIREARFTPDVRFLVRNWPALPDAKKKGVLHGLRLWAPYVDFLLDSGARLYFRRAPERVSDIEGFESLRDLRYWDNRLYDDIYGVATWRDTNEGRTLQAVIDLTRALDAPFFGGDLTAHETAHLFHVASGLDGCINSLYLGALIRAVFVSPYSAANRYEYFAVGVETYLTPADAPVGFGRNVGWLRANDPNLVRLLDQIGEGRAPSALTCPIP